MNQMREAELITQLQAGSTHAYQQLLDLHLAPINRYVTRMMGNANDAEDITQEVFIRLWQKSNNFNPALAKLSTWLHQIAHNLCIDFFRRTRPETNTEVAELSVELSSEVSGSCEPENNLLQMRQAIDIQAAIQFLPERQRSAIVMCHYQGLSNKVAAEIMSVSVDALESLLSRGRKKLRISLEGSKS